MKTLEKLLIDFKNLHLDDRQEWGIDINAILAIQAINKGYKEVYQKIIQDNTSRKIFEKETEINIDSNGEGNLPQDFKQMIYSPIDYEIKFDGNLFKIKTDLKNKKIEIKYIPKIQELINLIDEIKIPEDYEDNILDFAIIEYFRNQRDWAGVSNSISLANSRLIEKINEFWME